MLTVNVVENLNFSSEAAESREEELLQQKTASEQVIVVVDMPRNTNIFQSLIFAAKKINTAVEMHAHQKVIVCPCDNSIQSLREAVFIFGGFLILSRGIGIDSVSESLKGYQSQRLIESFEDRGATILDCWQALQHVRDIGWMDWKDGAEDDDQPFLVDEFLHYADAINGGIYIVAPGQLLLFSDPVDLPDQQQWAVVCDDDGSCSRRFSPAFYADLFADLGVAAVACLTESTTSGAAFAARGIEARDLRPGEGGSILRALDGLLSLTRCRVRRRLAAGWRCIAGAARSGRRTRLWCWQRFWWAGRGFLSGRRTRGCRCCAPGCAHRALVTDTRCHYGTCGILPYTAEREPKSCAFLSKSLTLTLRFT